MKTKTACLAIFLTLAHLTLQADIATTIQETQSLASLHESNISSNEESNYVAAESDSNQTVPETKYVSEQNESNTPKKDKSRLYNFLLALAAAVVAATAIIIVSSNKGKHAHHN